MGLSAILHGNRLGMSYSAKFFLQVSIHNVQDVVVSSYCPGCSGLLISSYCPGCSGLSIFILPVDRLQIG